VRDVALGIDQNHAVFQAVDDRLNLALLEQQAVDIQLLVVRELVDHLIEACGYGLKFGEILGFKPPSVLALANVAEL
jgi:hypothetical protein